jgi:hypothetical protein
MPTPESVVIVDEQVSRAASPTTDVLPLRSPWQSKYGSPNLLPPPLELGNAPWNMPEDLKWAMLRDPQVFAGYMLWKTAILVDGVQIHPNANIKKGSKRFELAREIAAFCLWNLNNMRGGIHSKLLQLLDSCIQGQKAASQVYRLQNSKRLREYFPNLPTGNVLTLDYLRVMPNDSYRIRTDDFGVVVGLQDVNSSGEKDIYPISKFTHCVFRPYDDHPLGTNILWPAYMPWYEKQQIAPERLANMTQFGSPSFVGITPEGINSVAMLDQYGQPMIVDGRPVEIPINAHMMQALQNFQGNGNATVIPYGGDLRKIEAANGGEIFRFYSDDKNLEIMKAMFFTANWTEQTKNPSSAQSKAGQGIGAFSIQDGKYNLADAVEESLLYNMTVMNYGEENEDLVPDIAFGTSRQETVSLANAVAALWSTGFFDNTQRVQLCKDLGLPEPDPDQPPINPNTPNKPTGNVDPAGVGKDNSDETDD